MKQLRDHPLTKNMTILPIFSLLILIISGCSVLGGDEAPDPRETFIGSYKVGTYNVSVTDGVDDITYSATSKPEIEFVMDDNLETDELGIDLEEFIRETMEDVLSSAAGINVKVSIEFEDEGDLVAEISGIEFKIDEFDFALTLEQGSVVTTAHSEFQAEGKLEGNKLTIKFIMATFTSIYINYSGVATGEKE